MEFHNPYQFIALKPATKKLDYTNIEALKGNNYVRHDRWHKDGLSGSIHCTLTATSPLVVGAEQKPGTKKEPGHVKQYQYASGKIAIPANSLRGMISNIAETLSNSSLRILASEEDCVYSIRQSPEEDNFKNLGILYKKGEELYLYPLKNKYRIGNYNNNNDSDTQFLIATETKTFQNTAPDKQFVYAKIDGNASQLSNQETKEKKKGILYIRGQHFNSKKSEYFIPWDGHINEEQGLNATQQVKKLSHILRLIHNKNEPHQQHPKGYIRDFKNKKSEIIKEGDLIYYKKDASGNITELSYSQIWRRPVAGNLYDAIRRSVDEDALPWNKQRHKLTPAECLFGVVEENFSENGARNLASRLQFTDATSTEDIKLEEDVTLKILDSPKPPSPAMYFKSRGGSHLAKKELDLNKDEPNGRKHYLPCNNANESSHWKTVIADDQPGKNWKQHLSCRPIPENSTFKFSIYFENLSPAELGLLRIAIAPAADAGTTFIHRLGLGKPLGLGHVTLDLDAIKLINRVKRYSLEGLKQPRNLNLDIKATQADRSLIDQESHESLLTLYNPNNTKHPPDNINHPVCYPFMANNAYTEEKGFEWFVNNEKQNDKRQGLTPIVGGKEIPFLESDKK